MAAQTARVKVNKWLTRRLGFARAAAMPSFIVGCTGLKGDERLEGGTCAIEGAENLQSALQCRGSRLILRIRGKE
jgi:hypothetical protein